MEEREDEKPLPGTVLVVDNGTRSIKAGFPGDYRPRCVMPAVVGYPKHPGLAATMSVKMCVGEEACCKRGVLRLTYPIQVGVVTNWEDMEKVWHHMFFEELQIEPNEYPILLTEAPLNPKINREKTAAIMFETFKVPAMYLGISAVLALYHQEGYNCTNSGIVLDFGEMATHAVPVYYGHAIMHAVQRLDIGGHQLTGHLMTLLNEKGHSFTTTRDREVVDDMKTRLCCIALDLDWELQKFAESPSLYEKQYELPDGENLTLGSERFCAPEVFFDPSKLGLAVPGVSETLYQAIMRCDVNVRVDMYANTLLVGGGSSIEGMCDRIRKEITNLAPCGAMIRVSRLAMCNCAYGAWEGGQILARRADFLDRCLTRAEYEAHGAVAISRKCF